MCIAIWKPQGYTLSDETIQESWNRNSDGAGFMYAENNELIVVKGLMTLHDFKLAYEPHKEKGCVLHFRIKTHGATDQENTHPFFVDNRLGIVHNGILSNVDTSTDPSKSDTWHFNQQYLGMLRKNNHNFFTNPIYKAMVEAYIGGSKLIFMDNKGKTQIFNEKMGVWDSECWFSNTSYKPWVQSYNSYSKPSKQKNQLKLINKSPINLVSKTDENPKQGDFAKTESTVMGQDGIIPMGSFVKILHFGQSGMIGIEEVVTQFKGTIHAAFLKLIPRTSMEEIYTYDSETLSVQDVEYKCEYPSHQPWM